MLFFCCIFQNLLAVRLGLAGNFLQSVVESLEEEEHEALSGCFRGEDCSQVFR